MELQITVIFLFAYAAIATEHFHKINKASLALIAGVLCWTLYIVSNTNHQDVLRQLAGHTGASSEILFFLMGAMTIVELIDSHDGFLIITSAITTTSKRRLLWIIGFLAFFLSAVLDNMTTTIVLVKLVTRLVPNRKDLLLFASIIVIAANAGGAWSPIGDVTTTMLWIGGQVTPAAFVIQLFLPSLVCLIIPLVIATAALKGTIEVENRALAQSPQLHSWKRNTVFISGIVALILVPVFKSITHLPPYMGILLGLGLLWLLTEVIHRDKERTKVNSVALALQKIDMQTILFFFGILTCISALQSTGLLSHLALWLDHNIHYTNAVVIAMGVLSAVVDNVPLVAGAMGMYDLKTFPVNHHFWTFLAYSVGTGGSILVIGSAAGVAAMGMVKIEFFWYLKKIAPMAFFGFAGGAACYLMIENVLF